MIQTILHEFQNPSAEFSPLPFWFLNDTLTIEELDRQIEDFHKKGVDGFVLHPRQGLPREPEYLSDGYMELIRFCVSKAQKLGMKVVLYDEACYPSGSCHGMVVAKNPQYAAKKLQLLKSNELSVLKEGESVYAYIQWDEDCAILADTPSDTDTGKDYALCLRFTNGRIRGIHADEDDGMPNAPLAADLLNPDATDTFLELTHEAYFRALAPYFGNTIIGFFTDEPSLTGRSADMKNSISWTDHFEEVFCSCGGTRNMIASLFTPQQDSAAAWEIYRDALRRQLDKAYYARLHAWCSAHSIALMGHPAESGDMNTQKYFGIPGQDLVWRCVSPENNLPAPHGVIGKCSADAARILGCRRNSNEVLGVCGAKGNPWDFSFSDMLWYFNYLFARGVNMLIPHAFYYSVRTPLQFGERPPDVGPHNIWWEDYKMVSDYIRRMCRLNTDAQNHPYAALLCSGDSMPQDCAVSLYENQIDFNYVSEPFLLAYAKIEENGFRIGNYFYRILLVPGTFSKKTEDFTRKLSDAGVTIIRNSDFAHAIPSCTRIAENFTPHSPDLRVVRMSRSDANYYLLINESAKMLRGHFRTILPGRCIHLNPMTGEFQELPSTKWNDMQDIPIEIEPRVATVLLFDPSKSPLPPDNTESEQHAWKEIIPINDRFVLPDQISTCRIAFSEIHDQCNVWVNNKHAGKLRFINGFFDEYPWSLDITPTVCDGENIFTLHVVPSAANTYGEPVPASVGEIRIFVK